MLHELFTRWLCTLHKIILAHHDENCECECAFCTSCGHLDTLFIDTFMRLMLCPPSLRFHGSTIPLFDWNCIDNKYDCFSLLFKFQLFHEQFFICLCPFIQLWFVPLQQAWKSVRMSCVTFAYDEGEVEYWMYEPVDLTEQSASNAATGSTMQGLTTAHHD